MLYNPSVSIKLEPSKNNSENPLSSKFIQIHFSDYFLKYYVGIDEMHIQK